VEWFKFNTLSVGSLTSTILLGIMFVYLLSLKNKTKDTWYLTGYLCTLFILLLSYTVRYSVFSHEGLMTGQFSNLIVFGVCFLVQFSYHYKKNIFIKESKIVFFLLLSVAFVFWIYQFFKTEIRSVYDFEAEYFTYDFGPEISSFTLIGYLWSITVLLRKTVIFSRQKTRKNHIVSVLKPQGRSAISSRSFAILILFTAFMAFFYFLFSTEQISRFTYSFIFNISSLIICLFIFITYLNNTTQASSFLAKAVGIPLAVILVSFGIVTITLTNALKDTLFEQFRNKSQLTLESINTRATSLLLSEVPFIVPEINNREAFSYYNPAIDENIIKRIEQKILVTEESGNNTEPGFFYVDLYDTESFFFYYKNLYDEKLYYVGFYYSEYRISIHEFILKIVIVLAVSTIFVLLLFPVIFRSSLLRPLKRILEGVKQVEAGNFNMRIEDYLKDEIGELASGYNMMVNSLKNAEGNFKALTENASDSIFIISESGSIMYANTRAVEMSGCRQDFLVGKKIHEFLTDKHGAEKNFLKKFVQYSECFETEYIKGSGDICPVEANGAKTVWHDKDAYVVILRDISERKKSEELLRTQEQQIVKADKLASLGALVGSVAHEVKNPNQVISLNTNFLEKGVNELLILAESPEQADDQHQLAGLPYSDFKNELVSAISEISKSTVRINRIVEELKTYVRGSSDGSKVPTDINEVIHSVVNISRHFIEKATDNFTLKLSGNLPQVKADKIQLEQVILNLIQNACQALPDKSRAVIISTALSGKFIELCIEDQGKGIMQADLTSIAEPFYTTRRDSGGTGLGLYVSDTIVKKHGGTMSFKSEPGKGTTVTVKLPAV
jgi:PAS domain S-box-containing protein